MQTKVKICGIRNIEIAKAAVKLGADFLGFNFVPGSKRNIDPDIALEIINSVRGEVKIVGVFQDAKINEVNKIASDLKLDYIQLHGREDNEYINEVAIPVIKSITIKGQPAKIKADYFLLDRPKRGQGKMVDLEKAHHLAVSFPLFYGGGLTADNVSKVVRKVKPFAVDVAGGIETNDHQDLEKIKLFIRNAKGVNL